MTENVTTNMTENMTALIKEFENQRKFFDRDRKIMYSILWVRHGLHKFKSQSISDIIECMNRNDLKFIDILKFEIEG